MAAAEEPQEPAKWTWIDAMRSKVLKNRILDTNLLWVLICVVLGIVSPLFHFLAIGFDLYGNPPHPDLRIDVYTHSVSSIAIVAISLNFNFGRKRRTYWTIPILLALVLGVVWELFEEAVIRLQIVNFYNTFWNAVQDVYIDVLGGIAAGFIVDEVVA